MKESMIGWLNCVFNTPYQQAIERRERERERERERVNSQYQFLVIYCTYSFVYWSPIMNCRGMIMRQDYTILISVHCTIYSPLLQSDDAQLQHEPDRTSPHRTLATPPPPHIKRDSIIIYFIHQISNLDVFLFQFIKQILQITIFHYMGHSWPWYFEVAPPGHIIAYEIINNLFRNDEYCFTFRMI